MYIRTIELEDIKSHTESRFEFQKGTTAIIGENGAGKTTLIEAIAWTLFDLLDYKKDAFLRRGAKRGVARVTFESVADERTYLVHRDTGTGYYVYDPELKTRLADKKEEVQRFLRQHLGVEPGTDLETLFRSAIGVPQGTFTSVFLETPANRKREFDKLLKVEEYRRSSERLIDTVNHIKGLVGEKEKAISYSRGMLGDHEKVRKEFKDFKEREKQLGTEYKEFAKKAEKFRKDVTRLEKIEAEISAFRAEIEKTSEAMTAAKVALASAAAEMKSSEAAAAEVEKVKGAHEEHLKALGMLKELERERGERERLNKEIAGIETALAKVLSDKERTEADLSQVLDAHKKIEELKPEIRKQKELERKRESLRNKLAEARNAGSRLGSVEAEVKELRVRYKEVREDLKAAKEAREEASKLPALVVEDDKLRERAADLKGRLENDRRFQKEMKNGLCPILTEKCLNLKEGQTLEGYLTSQFEELSAKIREAERGRKSLSAEVAAARKAESAAARLGPLERSAEEIADRGKKLGAEMESLEKLAASAAEADKELEAAEAGLKKLDNPEATVKLLREQAAKEIPLREMVTRIESNLERLESDKRLKVEQLENYKDLEYNLKKNSDLRDETAAAHRAFIANEEQAALLKERKEAFAAANAAVAKLEKEQAGLNSKIEKSSGGFDQAEYVRKRSDLGEYERNAAAAKANLENAAERRQELEGRLKEFEEYRARLKEDEAEKKRLEKILQTTTFIRSTLKEAAPRVARNYVHHVSIEANHLFREITGNAEHSLKWDEDYGISLEEGGFDRPFQNLSGGEQMAAALSVRLSLLKQLSDISLVFFDEPTTNLDLERRERLAEQISRITESGTFDQLFVISHDDTFEGYVDNVITIGED